MRDKQLHKIFSAPASFRAKDFFSTPELSQRLSLIRHLLQYSEQLLLLIAEKGGGKTYLLEQLRQQPDEPWHLFYLQGEPDLPEQRLLQQLLDSLSVNTDGKNREDLRNSLRSHISSLRYNGELPVLFVDDAHMLPLDSLQLLMDLSMRGEAQTRLRILLCCEPQITSLFSAPEFAIVQQTLIHTLDIPLLTVEQSNSYLDFRLKRGHYVGEPAFTDIQRHQFFQKSRGLPAGLNQAVLEQVKPETSTAKKPLKQSKKTDSSSRLRGFALGAIGFVVLLVLVNWLKNTFISPPADVIAELPSPISPRETPKLSIDTPDLQTMLPITTPIAEQQPPLSIPDLDEPPAEESVDVDDDSGIDGVQSIEWLSRQPADFYSIQIIGAHEKATLAKLLGEQQLDKRVPIAMFKTTRDQRTWYVLTYGVYPDREWAKQALDELPQALKNTGPWIRPLQDIHLLIEQQALADGKQ